MHDFNFRVREGMIIFLRCALELDHLVQKIYIFTRVLLKIIYILNIEKRIFFYMTIHFFLPPTLPTLLLLLLLLLFPFLST